MHHHKEIAGGAATGPGFALARQLDPLTIGHPCRDAGGQPAVVHDRALAVTCRARVVDQRPGAVAVRAGFGEGERPLVAGGEPGSVAHRAVSRAGTGPGTDAVTGRAGGPLGYAERHRHPGDRVGEADPHLGLDIGATPRPGRPGAASLGGPVEQATEKVAESARSTGSTGTARVAEDVVHVEPAGAGPAATGGRAEAAERAGRHQVPGLVVLLAFGVVGEHVIGLRHGLELVLGTLVAGVLVGMQIPGELAIGLLDLGTVSGLRDAEFLVEVLLVVVLGTHPEPPFIVIWITSFAVSPVPALERAGRAGRPIARCPGTTSSYLGTSGHCAQTGRSLPLPAEPAAC